jgi:protein involved in sex pheromone biosynthesis
MLVAMLFLAACSPSNTEDPDNSVILPGVTGSYPVVVDFSPSSVRNYHGTYLGSFDILEIGSQLIEKSKSHFSINDYILQEGQIINNDRLLSLVRRESPTNPQGLNPPAGSEFDIGNQIVLVDPILVADVVEINFMQTQSSGLVLGGIAVAIVLNQVQRIETATSVTTYEIDETRLYEYASDVGRKLESYLRTLNTVGEIPIYIGLYTTKRVDSMVAGGFIGDGYFVSRSGQFQRNNERWLIFPSNEVSSLDPVMSSSFNGLKQSLQQLLPESIGVIGKGRYIDDNLSYLKIDVQLVAKTFMEVKATTQLAASIIEGFENPQVHILVEIMSLNKTLAIIERLPNQSRPVITYIQS